MTGRPRRDRRRAFLAGHAAERLAALWLALRGYRILGRRVRTPAGEIDLLARRGRVLAVVEVKTRPDLAAAREAIGQRQRRRLAGAALAVQGRDPRLAGLAVRFDAVLVMPWRLPVHIIDAWRADSPDLRQGGAGHRS